MRIRIRILPKLVSACERGLGGTETGQHLQPAKIHFLDAYFF